MPLAAEIEFSEELGLSDIIEKYKGFPRLIAIKIDAQRRGVHYTDNALKHVDEKLHQLRGHYIFGARDQSLSPVPESLILRDGTTILADPTPANLNPYFVDHDGSGFFLRDKADYIESVDLWPQPAYYSKKTSSGTPMKYVVTARPQRLNIFQSSFCQFWANGKGCRFCDIVSHTQTQKKGWDIPTRLTPQDVEETLREAVKEPGRFTGICLTAGSDLAGEELFDKEVDFYIETLQAVGRVLKGRQFPSQLIASAFNEKQLARLRKETGLGSYTSDLEVLNERLFNWICPGKAEKVGYQEWKARLVRAVDVFGKGNVGTGIVGGVELAKPEGFKTEDEALEATLEEAEDLASKGVTTVFIVWVPRPGSRFKDQKNASLEYYVRLAQGLHDLRVKYKLRVDFDDYRRCGNHSDSDLSRLL